MCCFISIVEKASQMYRNVLGADVSDVLVSLAFSLLFQFIYDLYLIY